MVLNEVLGELQALRLEPFGGVIEKTGVQIDCDAYENVQNVVEAGFEAEYEACYHLYGHCA